MDVDNESLDPRTEDTDHFSGDNPMDLDQDAGLSA